MTQMIERKSWSYIMGGHPVSFSLVINLIPLVGGVRLGLEWAF